LSGFGLADWAVLKEADEEFVFNAEALFLELDQRESANE
jgi:hypothetical protein